MSGLGDRRKERTCSTAQQSISSSESNSTRFDSILGKKNKAALLGYLLKPVIFVA